MRERAEKRAARDVQALTGGTYTSALKLVRSWTAARKPWKDEIAKLAAGEPATVVAPAVESPASPALPRRSAPAQRRTGPREVEVIVRRRPPA